VAPGGGGDPAADGTLAYAVSTGAAPGANPSAHADIPPGKRPAHQHAVGPLRFERLKWISFTHSCIYTALLLCAFVIGKPQPLTFTLGLTHGLLWIFMSLVCITAARLRIVSLRLAVAVAVLGGIAPFFGSYEFVREGRRRAGSEPARPTGSPDT
jgi:hypothetical protein